MYYKAKVKELIEQDNGKMKKQTAEYLVDASSVTEVEAHVATEYKNATFDYELVSVTETKICGILNYAPQPNYNA